MDTIETLILELIDTIKTLAPEVFNIIVKKQLTDGIILLVVGVIVFIFSGWLINTIIKNNEDMTIIALPILLFIVGCACFFSGVSITINPEYFAIKDLIGLITGRPQ